MTKLNELIQQLCPDGVEYKKLKNAVSIERGKRVVKSQLSQINGFPVYQNSLIPLGYHTECNYPANTTFIIMAGAAGEIGYSKESFWAADDCFSVVCPEEVSNRYIYHILLHKQEVLRSKVRKASIPRLSRNALDEIIVPLPPIEVQREIVRILDNFTELTAELTARKKQYEYYRDKLLALDVFRGRASKCNVRTFRIDELCNISRGKVISKDYIKEHPGHYPVYSSQTENDGVLGCISEYAYDGEFITWTTDGANAGTVFFRNGKFSITNVCGLLSPKNGDLNLRYLYYVLSKDARQYVNKGMGNAKLMSNVMGGIKIAVPPLSIQNRIANVLDNFDAICSDLNMGLPAEIEARQKQYEYYRDKLLTFKEAKA